MNFPRDKKMLSKYQCSDALRGEAASTKRTTNFPNPCFSPGRPQRKKHGAETLGTKKDLG